MQTLDKAQKFDMATEYWDMSGLYQEKKDIYHGIISTIEKRNLSGYDIFLQTHFWILYHIIYHIFILDINILNISLNRIYIRDIISLDIYPSQVWYCIGCEQKRVRVL